MPEPPTSCPYAPDIPPTVPAPKTVAEMTELITLTDVAASKIKELMEHQDEGEYLRVFVVGGGCSGLNYGMTFDDAVEKSDHEFASKGVPLLVDEFSAPYIQGMTIDWEEGLMGAGFKMQNPNAQATCRCGQSFSS